MHAINVSRKALEPVKCSSLPLMHRDSSRVQGDCSSQPSTKPRTALKPGQCVLSAKLGILGWFDASAATAVWLDNLAILTQATKSNPIYWGPNIFATTVWPTLWLTNITAEGGGQSLYALNTPVYAKGAPALRPTASAWHARAWPACL